MKLGPVGTSCIGVVIAITLAGCDSSRSRESTESGPAGQVSACFGVDLTIEIEAVSATQAQRMADEMGVSIPSFPEPLDSVLTGAEMIEDGDDRGIVLHLTSGTDGPSVRVELKRIPDCYRDAGDETVAEVDGVPLIRDDRGSLTGYVADLHIDQTFVDVSFFWESASAPPEQLRLEIISRWISIMRSGAAQ